MLQPQPAQVETRSSGCPIQGTANSVRQTGQATLDASTVADRFWQLYQKRGDHFATVQG